MRRRTTALIVLVAAVLVAVLQSPATGVPPGTDCDLYASTAGDDDATGAVDSPFATVGRLFEELSAGQMGCLRGTAAAAPFSFTELRLRDKAFAGESDRVTIRSYPGEIAKLKGRIVIEGTVNYLTLSQLVLDGAASASSPPGPIVDGDHVSFTDNNVTNSASACFRIGIGAVAEAARIARNRIHDCKFDGVNANNSTNAVVEKNVVFDNGGWGVKLQSNAQTSSVRRNVLDGNLAGVFFGGNANTSSNNNTVEENIVSNSASWNVGYAWTDTAHVPSGNVVTRGCHYKSTNANGGLQTSPVPQGYQAVSPNVVIPPGSGDPVKYKDRPGKNFHVVGTPASDASPCFELIGDIAAEQESEGAPTDEQASAANTRPNVLFVVTDDQRADQTVLPEVMPHTLARLGDPGTTFSNAFATTPLCCPARSSIFSGKYAHNHGVVNNAFTGNLAHSETLQAYLEDRAGYRTGIFGKFLNDWNLQVDPPIWDEWAVLNSDYCPFMVREGPVRKRYPPVNPDGTRQTGECNVDALGGSAGISPYSTDYVADKAVQFINDADTRDDAQPWFLYVAPFAPHGTVKPAARHRNAPLPVFNPSAATFEADMSDKPSWNQFTTEAATFGTNDPEDSYNTREGARKLQLRSLMAVDDAVESLFQALEAQGEQDTLVVFVSDNGWMWGEHRLAHKAQPYTESIQVPLMARYPPLTIPGATDDRLAANIDLMPTALDVAGLELEPNDSKPDGVSLLQNSNLRDRMHTEQKDHWAGTSRDWASTRTLDYQYIEYYDEDGVAIVFREYYDLRPGKDPIQNENLYGGDGIPGTGDDSDTNFPLKAPEELSAQLRRDRLCVGSDQCPPGSVPGTSTDTKPPAAEIIAPSQPGVMSGKTVLRARAWDNLGVDRVEFWIDSSEQLVDTAGPYEVVWDTTQVADGAHEISVLAYDDAGNISHEDIIGAFVDNGHGVDIQMHNGTRPGNVVGRVDGLPSPTNEPGVDREGDAVVYTFAVPINPSDLVPGWNGLKPAFCPETGPAPLGCVTVGITGNDLLINDTDRLRVYEDDGAQAWVNELGVVNLADDDYVSYSNDASVKPFIRLFTRSSLELMGGNRQVRVTLGYRGWAGQATGGVGTAAWENAACACTVPESIEVAESGQDREF